MQSPIQGRSCIDIAETARQHHVIISSLLPLHALTGCDYVAATCGIGKTKAISVARKGLELTQLGTPDADIDSIIAESTAFMVACYCVKTSCSSTTERRQQKWAQTIGKSTIAPKLCSLQFVSHN